MTDVSLKTIAIVTPTYNEGENVVRLFTELRAFFDAKADYQWKLVFVDDGSRDDTWFQIDELSKQNENVTGIRLARNFGKEKALSAGAEAVKGCDAAIFMDADLQHPTSTLDDLLSEWRNGAEIVTTRRRVIKYSLIREIGAKAFYWLLHRFSELDIEPKTTDFCLLDRKVLKTFSSFTERTRFFRGIINWMGFRRAIVEFDAPERLYGTSKFGFATLVRFAINSVTSFSMIPLRVSGYLGLLVTVITTFLMLWMLFSQFVISITLYTPIAYFIVFNTFLFGVVLMALGMVAIYIGHIYAEVIQRPLYIISETTDDTE